MGQPNISPGIIFSDGDEVIPNVVWRSNERLKVLMDDAGHLTGAPELVVEVLSPGVKNERRDKQAKLKFYAAQGVREYWIADYQAQQVAVYRREVGTLHLSMTLLVEDTITSPLLPGFACAVRRFLV